MCCIHGICILAPGANASANMIFHPVSVKNKASLFWYNIKQIINFLFVHRDVTCAMIEGGGLFIHLCYARRISFEINSNSKEIRWAEHKYMNKYPSKLAF